MGKSRAKSGHRIASPELGAVCLAPATAMAAGYTMDALVMTEDLGLIRQG